MCTAAAAFPLDVFVDRSVSVTLVIPALDEAETITRVVHAGLKLRDDGVLDEVVVADGGSRDATVARAWSAGARVVAAAEVYPDSGPVLGRGDILWRSLGVIESDVVAFLDADLDGDLEAVIRGLVGPLAATAPAPADGDDDGGDGGDTGTDIEPEPGPGGFGEPDPPSRVEFVKGAFQQVAPDGVDPGDPFDGGRVTEMVARPLLNLWRPDLAGFHQPLSGLVAGRSSLLRSIPFMTGDAVEIGMLLDVVDRMGLAAVIEVDLGTVCHRPRSDAALAATAQEVLYGFFRRVLPLASRPRWQPYQRPGETSYPEATVVERPPIDPFGDPAAPFGAVVPGR